MKQAGEILSGSNGERQSSKKDSLVQSSRSLNQGLPCASIIREEILSGNNGKGNARRL
jgi:hypothetical protein